MLPKAATENSHKEKQEIIKGCQKKKNPNRQKEGENIWDTKVPIGSTRVARKEHYLKNYTLIKKK